MTITTPDSCICAYLAFTTPSCRGDEPEAVNGKLNTEASTILRVGDWVQYNTTDNAWDKIQSDDDVSAAQVGVIRNLKEVFGANAGNTYAQVDVSSEAFKSAIIWVANGGQVPCSETYIYDTDGTTRLAFAPETHTSLAGRVRVSTSNGLDGEAEIQLFSFN